MSLTVLLGLVVATGLAYSFVNGFHDGCNVLATIVASRSLSPRRALALGFLAELAGPFLFGTAVAATMASDILRPSALLELPPHSALAVLFGALAGAIGWNLITWGLRLPSSSSHALVGGLVGATLVTAGAEAVAWRPLATKVLAALLLSPVLGLTVGWLLLRASTWALGGARPVIQKRLKQAQVPSMLFLAASHGANDAQKSMGLIAMALMVSGATPEFEVPLWVTAACAFSIALGLSTGGWRIIRTVGAGIFKVRPLHSLAAQLASTSVILTASLAGGPVSTTQIVASSIIGVGTAQRASAVRWATTRNIAMAWIMTVPGGAICGALATAGCRIAIARLF